MLHLHPFKGILPFLFVLLLLGCTNHSTTDRMMDHADSLITYHDDSLTEARTLLSRSKNDWEQFSKRQRMRWLLLDAKLQNKAFIPFTTDSVMKEVADYYINHGSANEQMEACYLLGCVYRDLGDAPKAVDVYNEAEACADTTRSDCDYLTLSRICSQKSELYHSQELSRQSMAEADKGVAFALKAKDTLGAINLYNHKFGDYERLGLLDSAIIVNLTAAQLYKEKGFHNLAAMAIGANIDCYTSKKKYKEASDAIKIYEQKSGLFHHGDIVKGREIFYHMKGNYFLAVGQFDSAEFYFRKELAKGKDINNQYAATDGLHLLYTRLQKPDSTIKYALFSTALHDSILRSRQYQGVIRLQSVYDKNIAHKKLELKNQENKRLKNRLLIVCSILSISLLMSILVYKENRLNDEKKQNKLQSLYIKTKKELAERESIIANMQALVSQNQNKMDYEELLKENQEKTKELQGKIEEYEAVLNIEEDNELETALKATPVYIKFDKFCMKGGKPVASDWKELTDTIEMLIPKFHETIFKKTKLNNRDYYLCVLIRFGFRPTDINNLLGNIYTNITMKRSRLLKKIFGIDGSAKDFDRLVKEIK